MNQKSALEPKRQVAVIWAPVPSKIDCLWPLAALAGVGVDVGVVTPHGDGVVVVVEVGIVVDGGVRAEFERTRKMGSENDPKNDHFRKMGRCAPFLQK